MPCNAVLGILLNITVALTQAISTEKSQVRDQLAKERKRARCMPDIKTPAMAGVR
jgi:hypothetical protein